MTFVDENWLIRTGEMFKVSLKFPPHPHSAKKRRKKIRSNIFHELLRTHLETSFQLESIFNEGYRRCSSCVNRSCTRYRFNYRFVIGLEYFRCNYTCTYPWQVCTRCLLLTELIKLCIPPFTRWNDVA